MALIRTFLSVLIIISFSENVFAGKDNFEWHKASPVSQGLCTDKLDALRDALATKNTKTFLVIRYDKLVYEWYAQGFSPTRGHYTASLAKALSYLE